MSTKFAEQMERVLVVYKNDVYDLSKFAKRHPGGSAFIVDNIGKDITLIFDEIGHSKKAFKLMSGMFVSTFAEWKATNVNDSYFSIKNDNATQDSIDSITPSKQVSKYVPKESSNFHKIRRKLILEKYPEIERLFGPSFVPLAYGALCLFGFIYVGFYCGHDQGKEGFASWWFPLLMSWTVLPVLSFGLNNVNHEICHGNTYVLGLSKTNIDTWNSDKWSEIITKFVLLVNGVTTLNHFQFYYYSTSHKSHHGALGNRTDRGHSFRSLYFSFFRNKEDLQQKEALWDVDGDLFGLHPEHLLPDSVLSFDTFFDTPKETDVAHRVCWCYSTSTDQHFLIRGIVRVVTLTLVFVFLRVLGDMWTIVNTFCVSPCLASIKLRRPFDTELLLSSVCLFLAHFLWLYFGGVRSWVAVYVSSFSQPTHMPISIYFGYFFGIHSGVVLTSTSGSAVDDKISADVGVDVDVETGAAKRNVNNDDERLCQVTVSNYSWLTRLITFDQSLHCEHHDFPKIPCHLLGRLRHIAPEFYGFLPNSTATSTDTNNATSMRDERARVTPPLTDSRVLVYAGVQSYHYFWSPWVKFLNTDPSQYASCTDPMD